MQVLIVSGLESMALAKKSASASSGRAMLTRSETSPPSKCSAVSGALMRLVETSGRTGGLKKWLSSSPSCGCCCCCCCCMSSSSSRRRWVGVTKAPRGTFEAIVGTRDSCHPIPVLRMVTPAVRSSSASRTVSSQDMPPSTSSHSEMRKTTTKSLPRCLRTSRTSSSGNRDRLSKDGPPYSSVRVELVRGLRNWLSRYPSDPMISTPSYPASRASAAVCTNSSMVFLTPRVVNALAAKGEMGDLPDVAETANGW
mmetsp:Transcript_22631/g.63009  ORF Transcript_22631/g.63009 Transcript_22631/m.63009 type:complete len:254 (+) Transcript_22631:1290-2051(+)